MANVTEAMLNQAAATLRAEMAQQIGAAATGLEGNLRAAMATEVQALRGEVDTAVMEVNAKNLKAVDEAVTAQNASGTTIVNSLFDAVSAGFVNEQKRTHASGGFGEEAPVGTGWQSREYCRKDCEYGAA